jgi:hypothetical protein
VPFSIGCYALGVIFGAAMFLCMNQALKHWNAAWEQVARGAAKHILESEEDRKARLWLWTASFSFAVSIAFFFIGSFLLAGAIERAPTIIEPPPPIQSK